MTTSASQPGKTTVIFHYKENHHQQILNLSQLTALLHADLIFIDEFKEAKKLEKKIWTLDINGSSLNIYLK
ncbi:hypothetical protein [Bacillus weihaiensis]|uniref:Uncharacterized protein n=1 Tax=Bacillus weihaiensis TaxID=1547283 RepID=A0A1L3MM64_9BACI|nr:hypothetical protein [Bacillus weihaiensis]APH03448.1 hypothetical protein A9C19_01010 [Bacillus weihaiensis]